MSLLNETGLRKLTVPQLKLLCKEHRISGYSKLPKDNIIVKLLDWQRQQGLASLTAVSSVQEKSENPKPLPINGDSSLLLLTAQLTNSVSSSVTCNDLALAETPLLQPPLIIGISTVNSTHNGGTLGTDKNPTKTVTLKRKLEDRAISPIEKVKIPNVPGSSNYSSGQRHSLVLTAKNLGAKDATDDLSRKVAVPPSCAILGSGAVSVPTIKTQIPSSKPFKALVVKRALQPDISTVQAATTVKVMSNATGQGLRVGSLTGLDMGQSRDLEIALSSVTLPPSVAQRKHVPKLSLILSGISHDDLKQCTLVSRAFRYSVYLSASHKLMRKFSGRRLEKILQRHSSKMTNLWPYLAYREREAETRKTIYRASFIFQAMKGVCEISNDLWASLNDENQAIIAVRFLLTKLFFMISINNRTSAIKETIIDAEEVIPGEIWKMKIRSASLVYFVYVLEDTCEAVGRSLSGTDAPEYAILDLRADWTAYIANRHNLPNSNQRSQSLMESLQWTNHEEYYQGVSKLWITRIKADGEVGSAKLIIAKRYVLACVVGNSISGPWLSSDEMKQEFNSIPSRIATKGRERKAQKVNLFLPAHHHVESVHFSSTKNIALHSAVAVIQTPGREYYILRDNGMQIGCEEEGVAMIWRELLGCTEDGCSVL